jgi:hypothetical protein
MEGAPGLDAMVRGLVAALGAPGATVEPVATGEQTADWDVIYPVSAVRGRPRLAREG